MVKINRVFPFKNYFNPVRKSGYFDMVKKVAILIKKSLGWYYFELSKYKYNCLDN